MIKIINILIVIFFLATLIYFSLEERKFSAKKRKQLLWSYTIFLSLFFGVRDFGLDLEPYRLIFTELNPLSLSEISLDRLFNPTIEPFFVLLISAIKYIKLNYQAFLFISAAISFSLVAKVIEKNSAFPLLCLLFFYLLFLFKAADAVRHFVAASMYLFSIHLLSNKKPLRSYLLISASCLTHYANLITLLVAPFLKLRWRSRTYIIALALTAIISLPLGQILSGATSNHDFYLLWKLNYYLHNEEFIDYQNNTHKFLLLTMVYIYYLLIIWINLDILVRKQEQHLTRFELLLLNSQIIGSLIAEMFLFLDAFALAARTLLPLGIGSFFLMTRTWAKPSFARKNPPGLYSTLTILLAYNAVVILYNAGIHYHKSPFYLG